MTEYIRTHAHTLVGPENERVVGHVDSVALEAGIVNRLPVRRWEAWNRIGDSGFL